MWLPGGSQEFGPYGFLPVRLCNLFKPGMNWSSDLATGSAIDTGGTLCTWCRTFKTGKMAQNQCFHRNRDLKKNWLGGFGQQSTRHLPDISSSAPPSLREGDAVSFFNRPLKT